MKRMHILQHEPFEDEAAIGAWAGERGYSISRTKFFCDDTLPETDSFDLLLIMGGTMNIYEEKKYPWLVDEKAFIADVLLQGQASVLGVCLGAQLMADCLGGPVTCNAHREIGWFPVELTEEARQSPHFRDWPQTFTPFHWHGDTFAIPPDSIHIASSEACAHQAFVYGDRAVGLQFHLEYYTESIEAMLEFCEDELDSTSPFYQDPETIRRELHHVTRTIPLLHRLLDSLEAVRHYSPCQKESSS